MTIKYFYFLLVLLVSTTSCTAQIEVMSATKGNTGNRGIQPRDEQGNRIDPPKGKDYYALEMKTNASARLLAISSFIVRHFVPKILFMLLSTTKCLAI